MRGAWGAHAPLKFRKKIFFGQLLCKIPAYFGQKSCKIWEFCKFFWANIKKSDILIIFQAMIM